MGRTVEEIDADIARLQEEKLQLLAGQVDDDRRAAAFAIERLYDAGAIPKKVLDACSDKRGVFNPWRAFRVQRPG